jgi:hypothetical protein
MQARPDLYKIFAAFLCIVQAIHNIVLTWNTVLLRVKRAEILPDKTENQCLSCLKLPCKRMVL